MKNKPEYFELINFFANFNNMIRISFTNKEQKTVFPSLKDSLYLYKDAILNSIEEEDLETVNINLARLISVLERHNRGENRLNEELEEAKKRFSAFQRLNGSQGKTYGDVLLH